MSKRRNRRRRSRRAAAPVNVVVSAGGAGDPCSCPVCYYLAQQGVPTVNEAGERVQASVADVPVIKVRVRGTPETWPELSPEPVRVTVPAGTVLGDLIEYIRFRDPGGLGTAFAPGTLVGVIDGRPRPADYHLVGGELVSVRGGRDREWAAFASEMLQPIPGLTDKWPPSE